MTIKNTIKEHLRGFVSEASDPGISLTKKAHAESGKINKTANADSISNLAGVTKIKSDNFKPVKRELSKTEQESDDFQKRGGIQNLVFDSEVDAKYSERQEKAIKGGDGKAEPSFGASKADFADNLIKQTKNIKKLKDTNTKAIIQFGDDVELTDDKTKLSKKKIAVESTNKVKRLTFKKPFNGLENAISLIPESYKNDSNEFEITDGNESYRVRYVGNLSEGIVPWFALSGKVIGDIEVISHTNKKVVNEGMDKIKHLFDTLGSKKVIERNKLNETDILKSMVSKSRSIVLMEELAYTLKEYDLKESDLNLSVDKLSDKLMLSGQFETKNDAIDEAKILIQRKNK
jgi:hypothetical protein